MNPAPRKFPLSNPPAAVLAFFLFLASFCHAAEKPNVIIIFTDDLGYGDIGCNGATKVRTPNIDRLATGGRNFTDAHSASAVCTPSRYALLTGEYPFRTELFAPEFLKDPLVVDEDKTTIADVMKNAGYATAIIGKWHMGFQSTYPVNWNAELKPGPLELGFDYYYGVPTVNSHPPFVYVENHNVVGYVPEDPFVYGQLANTQPYPEKNKLNDIGGADAAHALYIDEQVGTHLKDKALDWIEAHKSGPFFLIMSTTQVHHPFTPAPQFQGTSDAGLYGDFIHELDWIVGEIMGKLEDAGVADNTLVIFTSDNGGMFNDGGRAAFDAGHKQNGSFLGFKSETWEGGHRVPFIAHWPGHVPANTVLNQLISGVDLLATMAALTGTGILPSVSPDGVNVLPALIGNPAGQIRDFLLSAGLQANKYAMRKGDWVYLNHQAGGGWGADHAGPKALQYTGQVNSDIADGAVKAGSPTTQLYNLATDPYQSLNVVNDNAAKMSELAALLTTVRAGPLNTDPVIERRGVNAAADYMDAGTVPPGWQYLYSNEAVGGTEVAMTPNVSFGAGLNTGFARANPSDAKLLGKVTNGGSFTINPANTQNAAVEGMDLLIAMGNDPAKDDHVIVRYTVTAADAAKGNATISGSFRDLSGQTTGNAANSIVGSVYHNSNLLFSATGANGKLLQTAGTFSIAARPVAAGDSISFVIGNNGHYAGDESALNASIMFDEGSFNTKPPAIISASSKAGDIFSMRFTGELGQRYQLDYSGDLTDPESWEAVESIPQLRLSPMLVEQPKLGDKGWWRISRQP